MTLDSEQYVVFSDAGYGASVRGVFPDEVQSTLKATRLKKKGHTAVKIYKVKVLDLVLEVPDALDPQ